MKKLLLFTALFIGFASNAQLRLVRDMRPNPNQSSNPTSFFIYDGRLFFSANHDNGGRFVYSTDGTSSGTDYVRFSNTTTGPIAVNTFATTLFYQYNNDLYFDARVSSTANIQIVKLSGASTAVNSVLDLTNFIGNTGCRFTETVGLNNKLLFNPNYINLNPVVIDLQNSANSGLLYDVSNTNADPKEFTVLGTNCFFAANDTPTGRELYKTDGTGAGTSLFSDVFTGSISSSPDQLNVLGTFLTFAATNSTTGRELFRSNGNTGNLVLIRDINTTGNSNPTSITKIGSELYFSANNGLIGQELWKSNGQNSGTLLIKDINPTGDSNPSKFKKAGSIIYFTANDGTNGIELWKTDGTAVGTTMVKDINTTGDSNPNHLTEYNGKLYFVANNGSNGSELWVSDGTNMGTTMVADVFPGSTGGTISELIVYNNELFFTAKASISIGQEIYAYKDVSLNKINYNVSEKTITLFPNPSKDYFELNTELNIEKVEVYSMLGQVVKTFDKQNQYSISDLAKGSYILKIKSVEGILSKTLLLE